jgi:hypothetical protein
MFESDADRLASIKMLGGQCISHESGQFWAIFDNDYASSTLGSLEIESLGPTLTCRTSDVRELPKDYSLTIGESEFRIKRHQIDQPAPGWTLLLLRA